MENEISSGTMLGIVLIALAAVIGIGFMVFSIAKGIANEGVVDLQDNLGQVSESAFEDFDQKIVTGTQVTSAYKTFQGKPVAILINTQAMNKGVQTHKDHESKYVYNIGKVPYINFNALLGADEAGALPAKIDGAGAVAAKSTTGEVTGAKGTTGVLALKDGIVETKFGYVIDKDTGKIVFDNAIVGMTKAGNSEYVTPNGKFDSNLIKDASGTTVGVVFTQLAR